MVQRRNGMGNKRYNLGGYSQGNKRSRLGRKKGSSGDELTSTTANLGDYYGNKWTDDFIDRTNEASDRGDMQTSRIGGWKEGEHSKSSRHYKTSPATKYGGDSGARVKVYKIGDKVEIAKEYQIPATDFYRGGWKMGDDTRGYKKDKKHQAKLPGRRVSRRRFKKDGSEMFYTDKNGNDRPYGGKNYYERRANRSDLSRNRKI